MTRLPRQLPAARLLAGAGLEAMGLTRTARAGALAVARGASAVAALHWHPPQGAQRLAEKTGAWRRRLADGGFRPHMASEGLDLLDPAAHALARRP